MLHRGKHLLERVVDERAAALIQMRMARDGITVRTGVVTKAIGGFLVIAYLAWIATRSQDESDNFAAAHPASTRVTTRP